MKYVLILLLIIIPTIAHAQFGSKEISYGFIEASVDPAQAIYGSKKNSRGLDFVLRTGIRADRVEVAIFYEQFQLINYQSYGSQVSYVVHLMRNVHGLIGTEVSIINRMGSTNVSYGFSGSLQYHLQDFYLVAKADLKRRTDVSQNWGYSNYVGIGYKFKLPYTNNHRLAAIKRSYR